MTEQEPTQEQLAVAVYEYAMSLQRAGDSPGQIKRQLVEQGLDMEAANIVVNNLGGAAGHLPSYSRSHSHVKRVGSAAGNNDMLYGALWCIGGIVVTAFTYSAAANGGTYVVAWGAIVFGAIQFFRGVANAG